MSHILRMMMGLPGAILARSPEDGGSGGSGADASSQSDAGAAPAATALGGDADPGPSPVPSLGDAMYPNDADASKDGTSTNEEKTAKDGEDDGKPKEGEEGKEKEGEEGKQDEPPAIKPEDYDLSAPEGFDLDEGVSTKFREFAAERNWSKEDVSALKDMQIELYRKQAEAHAEQVAAWGEELKTDKEIGGAKYQQNVGAGIQFRDAFFDKEAKDLFNKTGLGNHPAIVRGFVRAGLLMGEQGTISGGSKNKSESLIDAMYGDAT
jgi:hypothetical protein